MKFSKKSYVKLGKFKDLWALLEQMEQFRLLFNLTVPRIIDWFGRKRCQKKHKDVVSKILLEFFQKYQLSKISSLHTYVCYASDVLF